MIENFENIGLRISEQMDRLNLKQADICRMTGISKNAMSNYVNGNRVPDTLGVYKLSKALKVSIEWLLTGESEDKRADELSEGPDGLSTTETDIIKKFRQLDYDSQDDVIGFIDLKYNKQFKRGTSSNSNTGGTDEEAATSEAV